jgi:hypothetical protein
MSTQVNVAFVQQYNTNVDYLLQQRGSRLSKAVTKSTAVGKAAKAVEQVGAVGAVKRTTRHGDTPLISTPHDARWAFPVDYEFADLIDDQDKLRMLIDPQSPYAMNAAYAMGRAIDDEIIGAFNGTAKTGENGTTPTPLPSAQVVPMVAAEGLTLAKLQATKLLLMAAEVDVDNDPLWMAISAEQHDDLLTLVSGAHLVTASSDFNTTPSLVGGKVTSFMGFNFIHTERLLLDGSSDRLCPAWAQSGMHCVTWEGLYTQITERPDKSYSTQVYCRETIGATRLEEQKVVMVTCGE